MPTLQAVVSEDVETGVYLASQRCGLSVSKFLARLIRAADVETIDGCCDPQRLIGAPTEYFKRVKRKSSGGKQLEVLPPVVGESDVTSGQK